MEENSLITQYRLQLVQEMLTQKGAISVVKEFCTKQNFIDDHQFQNISQNTTSRFLCVVQIESPQWNFPKTEMGRSQGQNQKVAKNYAYELPKFFDYLIQYRKNYSDGFIDLLEKINNEQEAIKQNLSLSISMSNSFQESLFENLIQMKIPLSILEQFCNYYKFQMTIDVDENDQSFNQDESYQCKINLKLLDKTISCQGNSNTKKTSKFQAAENLIGQLIGNNGKFQNFAMGILEKNGNRFIQDNNNIFPKIKKKLNTLSNNFQNSDISMIKQQDKSLDNQDNDNCLFKEINMLTQNQKDNQSQNNLQQNNSEFVSVIPCPQVLNNNITLIQAQLEDDNHLNGVQNILIQGQNKILTIMKSFQNLNNLFISKEIPISINLSGSYINTLFLQEIIVDIKIHSDNLNNDKKVIEFIHKLPTLMIEQQIDDFKDINIIQLNDRASNNSYLCYQIETNQKINYRILFIYESQQYDLSKNVFDIKQQTLSKLQGNFKLSYTYFMLLLSKAKQIATQQLLRNDSSYQNYIIFQLLFEYFGQLIFQKYMIKFQSNKVKIQNANFLSFSLFLLSKLIYYDKSWKLQQLIEKQEKDIKFRQQILDLLAATDDIIIKSFFRNLYQIYISHQDYLDINQLPLLIQDIMNYKNNDVFKGGQ